jgi:hypothetical protein
LTLKFAITGRYSVYHNGEQNLLGR